MKTSPIFSRPHSRRRVGVVRFGSGGRAPTPKMLLAKINALRAAEAEEAASADTHAPQRKQKKKRRQRREVDSVNHVAVHGWRKVRIAGLKEAARRRRLLDVEIQNVPDGPVRRFRGHHGAVLCTVLSGVGDGQKLVPGGADGDVRVWRLPDENDERYVDLRTDTKKECVLTIQNAHHGPVCAVTCDTTGELIFTAGSDNAVKVWQLRDGSCLRSISLHSMSHFTEDKRTRDLDADNATASEISRGRKAYSTTFSQTPKVFNIAVSGDNKRCFAVGSDRDLKVWDVSTGTLRVALAGHDGPVGALSRFNKSETQILTGSGDGTIRAWNLLRGKCELTLEAHAEAVNCIAVSSDDSRFYSVGSEGDVHGWSATWLENVPDSFSARSIFTLPAAHRGMVIKTITCTKSSGGSDQGTLFTGGEDGKINVWRASDGKFKCALTGHGDWISGLTVCSYGKNLCSTSHDGTSIIWRVGKLVRQESTQRAVVTSFLGALGSKG